MLRLDGRRRSGVARLDWKGRIARSIAEGKAPAASTTVADVGYEIDAFSDGHGFGKKRSKFKLRLLAIRKALLASRGTNVAAAAAAFRPFLFGNSLDSTALTWDNSRLTWDNYTP